MKRSATLLALASLAILASCQDNATGPTFAAVDVGQSFLKDAPSLRARGATNNRGDFRAHFNAHSGLKGENAKGHWFYRSGPKGREIRQVADVVCLSVTDNQAVLGLHFTNKTTDRAHPAGSYALVVVQDNGKVKKQKSPDAWAFADGVKLPKPDPKKGGKDDELRCDQSVSVRLASWPGNIRVEMKQGHDNSDDDGVLMVTPSEGTLNVGETLELTAAFTNSDDDNTFSWSSSDVAVATVDATGVVTATGAGTATITVASGSASAAATITVNPSGPPMSEQVAAVFTAWFACLATGPGDPDIGVSCDNQKTAALYALAAPTLQAIDDAYNACVAGAFGDPDALNICNDQRNAASLALFAQGGLFGPVDLDFRVAIYDWYINCLLGAGGDVDTENVCRSIYGDGIRAVRTATVTVKLIDAQGHPIVGGWVSLIFEDGERPSRGPSDATGTVTFTNQAVGLPVRIIGYDATYNSAVVYATLVGGESTYTIQVFKDSDGDGIPDSLEAPACVNDPSC